ncbi:MAG: response regulator [Gammaproteobacteria bacterium]|nr:response regulator [Gammaproteobacteria bacterium]
MAKLTALIADDSLSARKFLREALEKAGLVVTESKDGNDALQLARDNNYDLILADLYLPLLDGIDLTSTLRKLPEYSNTPILAVSNNKSNLKKEAVKQAGASGLIRLPIQVEDLLKVLKSLLGT